MERSQANQRGKNDFFTASNKNLGDEVTDYMEKSEKSFQCREQEGNEAL